MKNLDFRTILIESKGITLVALVISIIVLLILSTVSINLIINNGILDKAKLAVDKYSEGEELEQIQLAVLSAQMNKRLTTESLNTELQKIFNNDNVVTEISDYYFYKASKSYRIYKDGKVEEGALIPDEFQQVEYIESSGTQWIDTGFKPTINTKIRSILSSKNMGKAINIAYYGARTSPEDSTSFSLINYKVTSKLRFDRGTFHSSGNSNAVYQNTFYEIIQDKNENYINGIKISESNGTFNNVNYNLFIFGINECGSYLSNNVWSQDMISLKLFQIYDNAEIIRDYIPCHSTTTVTNVDGVQVPANTKGLYDLIEGKFYTNQGSGDDFIAGPDV